MSLPDSMAMNALSEFHYEGESSSPPSEVKTVVLVGRIGNGKSATGNSILGRNAFKQMFSSTRVTNTCEMHTTVLEDGQNLAVIDTPGLFDFSRDPEFIGNEMAKCMSLAKGGIHAILLIMSIRTRFTREEEAGVLMLQNLFGPNVMDHVIVVFTGGDDFKEKSDEFEEKDATLDDYLCGTNCPDQLKETLAKCGNRCVLFDNKTKDKAVKSEQLKQLVVLVNEVLDKNGGKPYTNDLFVEPNVSAFTGHQAKVSAFTGPIPKGSTNKLHAETSTVSSSFKNFSKEDEIFELNGDQLLEIAHLKAENEKLSIQLKTIEEVYKLRLELEKTERKNNEMMNLQPQGQPKGRQWHWNFSN